MAARHSANRSVVTHVVPIDAPPEYSLTPRRRHLSSVDQPEVRRSADVVDIASRRQSPRPARVLKPEGEPAVLARWAVFLAVIMLVAAATSGQA